MPQINVYTVKDLNLRLQELIGGEPWLNSLCVEGEITGLGTDKRGHMYFSLKDPSGVLSAVMFSGKQMYGLKFKPKNGDKVHAFGKIDVFLRDGKYQLYVDRLVRVGEGEVNARLEQLKARLDSMGLFSQEYKKPIPPYPRRIGIVTAADKAAISDIQIVAKTRDPYAQLVCYPATVQGQYAAADISRGIELLDDMGLDVIIVGRGGGSTENLWAFNEEQVAWAIFNARTPIITATGHEIDYTVADLVADKRESNPSTAVMHALPVVKETVARFDSSLEYITALMNGKISGLKKGVDSYDRQLRLLSPSNQLQARRELMDRLYKQMNDSLNKKAELLGDRLTRAEQKIDTSMGRKLDLRKHFLEVMTEKLHGLSPTAKLINGFGYVAKQGNPVMSVRDVSKGSDIEIILHDGIVSAVVTGKAGKEE